LKSNKNAVIFKLNFQKFACCIAGVLRPPQIPLMIVPTSKIPATPQWHNKVSKVHPRTGHEGPEGS
jgi:hypothetical protein